MLMNKLQSEKRYLMNVPAYIQDIMLSVWTIR